MKKLIKKIKFHSMRALRKKSHRTFFINKRIKQLGKTEIPLTSDKTFNIDTNKLNVEGYFDLGNFLNKNEIDIIIKKTTNLKCFDPFRVSLNDFNLADAPSEVHNANYRREDLVKIKEVLEIANNSSVLNAVQNFLGATPTISNINMWWSFSGKKEAEQAQFFHRDVDDFKFIKLFIYLTDVAMENGPHVYVEGSSNSSKLRKIGRYKDKEIIEAFGQENIKYFTAPKGNSFLVDTYGFHKGLLPKEGKRLLLQVQYSLNPIGIEEYTPTNIGKHNYDSYINRLLIE